MMEKFEHVRRLRRGCEWINLGEAHICLLDEILGAVIWREAGGVVTTLTPLAMR